MVSNNFRHSRKICYRANSKLPIAKNRLKKLLLFRQMAKNYTFILGHIAISQPMLKIMS